MAKRIYELDAQTTASDRWVLEVDEPAGLTAETEKIKINELPALLNSVAVSWTSLTLVNGWGGTAKYRIVTMDGDEYVEVFFDLTDGSATNSTFATIATLDDRTDYDYDVVVSSAGAKFVCNNSGNLQIISYAGTGTSYGYSARILRLTP